MARLLFFTGDDQALIFVGIIGKSVGIIMKNVGIISFFAGIITESGGMDAFLQINLFCFLMNFY